MKIWYKEQLKIEKNQENGKGIYWGLWAKWSS